MKIGVVGDSIMKGSSSENYGYLAPSFLGGAPKLLACELIREDVNYIPISFSKGHGEDSSYLPRFEITANKTYNVHITNNLLTIYYMVNQTDVSTIDVDVDGLTTKTLSSYMPYLIPDNDEAGDSLNNIAKVTYSVDNGYLDVVFSNLVGTSFSVCGFADGEGVEYLDISRSSSTLLDIAIEGITSPERIAKMVVYNPDMLIFGWGTNDSKDGVRSAGQAGVDEFKADFKTIVYDPMIAANPNIEILLMTAPAGAVGSQYENNILYNVGIRELAVQYSCTLFDVEAGNYQQADDVHLTKIGYSMCMSDMFDTLSIIKKEFDTSTLEYTENGNIPTLLRILRDN